MAGYELDEAYEIKGPADAKARYDTWAETYDTGFAEAWGYVAPREIAGILAGLAGDAGLGGPVLDIGAGTGLVGAALAAALGPDRASEIDAIDISPEMLARAAAKGIYRQRIEADLTLPLALPDAAYAGLISSGTFTHGHVGPEALPELLRVARPGALFVLGTIPPVFDGAGLGSALGRLVAAGEIGPLDFREIPIYEGADHPHADDRGLVMVFRRR
ncbi:class I SAM-dependent methyltransferase [Paralimibaculum aggregatum]|uniref:Class I SAM-dependent methyltransferase n=1 Tax=Paralimibaculum aggregatum TaxID=3036245 RepID=A0ABQ6LF17_9RHOB|nr:methyltransferase domain-containing protein [Limibaculum sp. NKW23]GMG81934.1 class I SAM-dependent methyltransferase [Limibaculum sp. NKW23]